MGFKSWETPPDFFKALDDEFHFTLDAAASHDNHLCERYCTIDGTFSALREHDYNINSLSKLDGLTYPWIGERVFCNPPYDNSLGAWVDKALSYEAEVAVLLLPPSVDTAWFHRLCADPSWGATRTYADHNWVGMCDRDHDVIFMEGRLRFWRDGKPGDSPRAGNLLAVIRG